MSSVILPGEATKAGRVFNPPATWQESEEDGELLRNLAPRLAYCHGILYPSDDVAENVGVEGEETSDHHITVAVYPPRRCYIHAGQGGDDEQRHDKPCLEEGLTL